MRVVTTWGPKGWTEYAERCARSLAEHWPRHDELVAYVEKKVELPRWEQRDLNSCEGLKEFLAWCEDHPEARGAAPVGGWGRKANETGYSWQHDAAKFCRQLFVPEHASSDMEDGDVLIWLDADVLAHQAIPEGIVDEMLEGHDLAYVGRSRGTECGFWAVRLKKETRAFLYHLPEMYRSHDVFKMREWHSGRVFDEVRQRCELFGMTAISVGDGSNRHPWFSTPIGRYTDHLKGPRKRMEKSPERR